MRRLNISHHSNFAVIKPLYDEVSPTRFVNTKLRDTSPVDDFYSVEEEFADGTKLKVYRDPIFELFNQDRINRLGNTSLEAWIKSMMNLQSNPLSELREKCSDADLLAVMKSRYCQTPSEVMKWARYLNNNLSELEKQVSLAREEQEKLESSVNPVEPASVVAADGAATTQSN